MGRRLTGKFAFTSNGAWVASVVAIICFLTGIAVTAHVGLLVRNELVSQHKQTVRTELSEARARLEGEISRIVAHGLGFRAFLAEFNDRPFVPADYQNIANELFAENPAIRSIGLAPDNIVRAVYPMEPNQAALGLDYRSNASQWPAVERAMNSRETVISGPLQLVQGGRALLIRIPVYPAAFADQPLKDRSYWGVATLALDEETLMQASGINAVVNGTSLSIVDGDAGDAASKVLFGNLPPEGTDFVSLPLFLPGGLNWKLLGYPKEGWSSTGKQVWITQFVGSLISLIFGVMAFLLISEIYKVRSMALHDPLTGLANRRLLEERMYQLAAMCERSGVGFEIFYVDLDAFKPVNDNYGHSVGDQLLVAVGGRLQSQTRQYDTVARVGGDEFIVLTPGSMRRLEREAFVTRLSERVSKDFEFSGTFIDVRASIGSASFPKDAMTVEDLLRVADGRMYAQKAKSKQASADIREDGVPQAG